MADIDRLSRKIPNVCKVAPSSPIYHLEDVHRAGGVLGILAELSRGQLIHRSVNTVYSASLGEAIDRWDITKTQEEKVVQRYLAAPGGVPTQSAFSQSTQWPSLDLDRVNGCIRDFAHAYSSDGGLAVLYGNLAKDGCIVKTAGVDPSCLVFSGPAHIFESQEAAVE